MTLSTGKLNLWLPAAGKIKCSNQFAKKSQYVNYLGVIIDKNFNFLEHIIPIEKKRSPF